MVSWRLRGLIILLLISLVGCASLPFQLGDLFGSGTDYPGAGISPTSPPTLGLDETTTPYIPQATPSRPLPSAGNLVRIWLSPEFDPDGDNPASRLLKDRLVSFVSKNPDVRLEVRVKAVDGSGGLLDSLVAANAAAPLALPDLVLLPRSLLEAAALKGLLYTNDELSTVMDEREWFEYARQLSRIKTVPYGIPFAGDALVLAYHPSQVPSTPGDLEGLLLLGKVLLFPASDPQALYSLCLYLAEGKSLQDSQGRPWIDEDTLRNILAYDQRASIAGVMPYWLSQYSSDVQIWESFKGTDFSMAATWVSTYMRQKLSAPDDLALAALPTFNGTPYNLATGWSWALAGQDPERRSDSVRLVKFMVEKDFLAQWSMTAGYMPPRTDALNGWQQADLRQLIEQISLSAQLTPPADVISSLGPILKQAVVDVLKNQSDPQDATRAVIEQVNQP